jgi:hypothetical protein
MPGDLKVNKLVNILEPGVFTAACHNNIEVMAVRQAYVGESNVLLYRPRARLIFVSLRHKPYLL